MDDHELRHESEEPASLRRGIGWLVVCLLLLGSAWGLSELVGGETVWLTARALLLLAVARVLVNRPGSSTAMAGVAVLFRSVNAAPFLCHLAGIALLGLAFDITATLLWREQGKPFLRFLHAALTGVMSAYLSCLLFATTMVWIVEYRYWAGGGLGRVAEYTLTSGSRGALAAVVVVPAGLWLGRLLARQAAGQPRAAVRAAAATCLALWLLGPIIG